MTVLSTNASGELHLTLRGTDEDRILTTLRRWPHWQRADVETDPDNPARTIAVTLVTDRINESPLREILKRSFGMVFPVEGGVVELAPEPPARVRRRSWYR